MPRRRKSVKLQPQADLSRDLLSGDGEGNDGMLSWMGTDVKQGTKPGLSNFKPKLPHERGSTHNKISEDPIGYPCSLMILSLVMWSMSFIGLF